MARPHITAFRVLPSMERMLGWHGQKPEPTACGNTFRQKSQQAEGRPRARAFRRAISK
jgi:hypothetical protein